MLQTKFGRLTVVGLAPRRPNTRHTFWECQCDCGQSVIVDSANVKNRHTQSCGCLRRYKSKTNNLKHGRTRTTEFNIWVSMRQRCRNKANTAFKDYGGRGITVDPKWDTFEQFFADMGARPSSKLSLDRIDNSGPYSPTNCRWTTQLTQTNNSRKNVIINFSGRSQTLAQWARELDIKPSTIRMRLSKKWSVQEALKK